MYMYDCACMHDMFVNTQYCTVARINTCTVLYLPDHLLFLWFYCSTDNPHIYYCIIVLFGIISISVSDLKVLGSPSLLK